MIAKILIKLLSIYRKIFPKVREITNHKQLGLEQDVPDDRDFLYTAVDPPYLPEAWKFDSFALPPVKHQGRIGSCCSHAVIAAYETLLLNFTPRRYLEGSELYHYYNARKYVNFTYPKDKGMTIRVGCKTIKDFHMAIEYACPYVVSKYNDEPPMAAYMTSGAYKVKHYERLFNLEDIKKSIFEKIPVICGIKVYTSYNYLSRINYLYKPSGNYRNGHAQLIVGYDNVKKVFTLRNSWGSKWGLDGTCEMSYADFKKYSFDWWRIII